MIRRHGPRKWDNIHVTQQARLKDLIDVDNAPPGAGAAPAPLELLRQTAGSFDEIIQDARRQRQRIRGLGSAWALTDIAITDGWLVNTKLLNGIFEVADRFFAPTYPAAARPLLVLAQCGASINELNIYLEVARHGGMRRALKTAGIGAGQTVVGAVQGNTHGAGIAFGSTPDFIAGLHLVTGTGGSYWIERHSAPVLNADFAAELGAELLRDDDVFDACVVSFGAFGLIAAVAVETDPLYHLVFPPVREVPWADLGQRLGELATLDYSQPDAPYHYEFIFNPWDDDQVALEGSATKVAFEEGHPAPEPMWIARDERGYALGARVARLFLDAPIPSSRWKTAFQFKEYRNRAILEDLRCTPGQAFTATITYFEGYNETAIGVSINDAATMMAVSRDVARRQNVPCMSQVRVVHPSRGLLAFTHLPPKTAIFEYGLANNDKFAKFEKGLLDGLAAAGAQYTLHWSKNAGITAPHALHMYGGDRIDRWRAARERVFQGDAGLKRIFSNAHLERAGLA